MNFQNGQLCISGARDRTLVLWRLPNDENKCPKSVSVDLAHDGWIWDLTSIDETIYSCSWDRTIKAWALSDAGLTHLTTYEMYNQNFRSMTANDMQNIIFIIYFYFIIIINFIISLFYLFENYFKIF